jgi:glycosyltransferase involved in cell wall biosynthesis
VHVALDLTALLPTPTGVDVYLRRLLEHLGRLDRASRYTVFVNREDRGTFAGVLPANFTIAALALRPRPVRFAFQHLVLPAAVRARGIDVVHSPAFLMPFARAGARHVVTVHDMTFFSHRAQHSRLHRSAPFLRLVAASLRRADLVVVPSGAVRADVLRLAPTVAPTRIRVVANGVGAAFRPQAPAAVAAAVARLGIREPYVLYVGTLEPRKNLVRLLDAYERLAPREQLVLAGRLGWDAAPLRARLTAPALRGRVHLTGYVPEDDLPALYAGARAFVYPSLAEGFGLPPLEALACGVPVVASTDPALAENLADAALLVDATDTGALADAMRRVLADDALRATLRERGRARAATFGWERTAAGTLACYRELAAR